MSWVDKVNTQLIIKTGDGKTFTPNWMNASKSVDFNVTEFNFPNVQGTLVDRREAKGAKYNLEIYFQGDDYLEASERFEIASKDKRYWTLTHPMYGTLFVQPVSLNFDNSKYNVSKITGTVIETITETYPQPSIIPEDEIEQAVLDLNDVISDSFTIEPVPSDVANMEATLESTYTTYEPNIDELEDKNKFLEKINNARNEVRNITTNVNQGIRAMQNILQAPALFQQDISSRLSMMKENFDTLRDTVQNISSNPAKFIYESLGGFLISGTALALSKPSSDSDYANRVQVTEAIETLILMYNGYIEDLDSIQVGTGNNPTDYIPNYQSIQQLNEIVYFTLANLYQIGLNAKQERIYVLTEDSNFVLLAHRFYGLDENDNNLNELIRNNNLGLNGILNIKKDTPIKYYI